MPRCWSQAEHPRLEHRVFGGSITAPDADVYGANQANPPRGRESSDPRQGANGPPLGRTWKHRPAPAGDCFRRIPAGVGVVRRWQKMPHTGRSFDAVKVGTGADSPTPVVMPA